MIEWVDVATAQAADGVRLVVASNVPSPWSEAAKGLFAIGGVPVAGVRAVRDAQPAIKAWTGVDNVPIVVAGSEPARTTWSAIVALASRLAGPDVLLPSDPRARAEAMGTLDMIAGEDGLGWCGRLMMIDASLVDNRGFAQPIGAYLGKRYAGAPIDRAAIRTRVTTQLAILVERLGGRAYFGGDRPVALDIYAAAFLTPLSEIPDDACPGFAPHLRPGFAAAHAALGDLVPPALVAHRKQMMDQHLGWPIAL